MCTLVTPEQIRAARRADLYRYLLKHHPNEVCTKGGSLRLVDNKSLSIRPDFPGFYDFATMDKGNSIDFLIRYFDYDFTEAVAALCGDGLAYTPAPTARAKAPTPFVLPEPADGEPTQLIQYLTQYRCIPSELVRYLLDAGLVYQERSHRNILFTNSQRTYAEVRGSAPALPFRGMVPGSDRTGYFWFKSRDLASIPDVAYICEGAIDAISLYCIHQVQGYAPNVLYCSIGGVANQQRIDVIKSQIPTVIAVDNDDAGQQCRERNQDCQAAIPIKKDWNDDWRSMQSGP